MNHQIKIIILFISTWIFCTSNTNAETIHNRTDIKTGAEQLSEYVPLLKGKRVGLTVNQSSMISNTRLLDTLVSLGVQVVRGFGPEHGLSGIVAANTYIEHGKDEKTGIEVVSLFGPSIKPTAHDLRDIDVMVFDMQDVGVRFYTYITTLHYIMEACAENNIELIVLDRPNPNDYFIDGPILDEKCKSFIGMHPIPIVHAVTMAEYAKMINGEKWLKDGIQCKLKVVPMKNYFHGKHYKLPINPSPNINTEKTIYLYPSLCWYGSTAISDGRGTYKPFQIIGSPLFQSKYPFSFIPQPIEGMNINPRHKGETCYGVDLSNLSIEEIKKTKELKLGLLIDMYKQFPDKSSFFNGEREDNRDSVLHFDQQVGNQILRSQLKSGMSEVEIRKSWKPGLTKYKKMRKKYLIYS